MKTERIVHSVAGFFVMASVILGLLHSPWWLAFTLIVGANLFIWGITNFCPMETTLKKFGIGISGCACDSEPNAEKKCCCEENKSS